ncbi:MAG: hypothetical protein JNJ41_13790 [Bacteroidia bacterium]|nr:hypothetical protein [Bacteroidia bacterium]
MDDGCCKDENRILKNNPDFTLKQHNTYDLVKSFCELFYVALPFPDHAFTDLPLSTIASIKTPPPKLQSTLVVSTSVLRI